MKKIKLDAGAKKAILLGFGFFGVILGVSLAGVPLLGIRRKKYGEWQYSKFPLVWDAILGGESLTWNDYNVYTGSSYQSHIFKNKTPNTLPFTNTPLTELTLGQVREYQKRKTLPRLHATGRFQIIGSTLQYCIDGLNLNLNKKYDQKTQQECADYLITNKQTNIGKYLLGKVEDTDANLRLAALGVAREWSSVGVPYAINGVGYNQSYYLSQNQRASISTETIQTALREQRKQIPTWRIG
jgi:hypothetical protein